MAGARDTLLRVRGIIIRVHGCAKFWYGLHFIAYVAACYSFVHTQFVSDNKETVGTVLEWFCIAFSVGWSFVGSFSVFRNLIEKLIKDKKMRRLAKKLYEALALTVFPLLSIYLGTLFKDKASFFMFFFAAISVVAVLVASKSITDLGLSDMFICVALGALVNAHGIRWQAALSALIGPLRLILTSINEWLTDDDDEDMPMPVLEEVVVQHNGNRGKRNGGGRRSHKGEMKKKSKSWT